MPDTDETPVEETPQEAVVETPAPQFVTRDDFDRANAENRAFFAEQAAQQRALVETLVSASRRSAQPEPTGDPTDEQLQAAVDEGRISVAQMVKVITAREQKKFAVEQVDPLRKAGAGSISSLTKQLALSATGADGKALYPHARRYEKEIDKIIDDFSGAGTVVTPEIYKQAYRFVLGDHVDEIADERHEQRLRAATAPKPEGGGSARSGRQAPGKNEIPTPSDLFGEVGQKLVDEKGGADSYAKKLGYKGGWKEYAELHLSQQQESA